jgi:hypothetical protein
MQCTVYFIVTLCNVGNVLLCVIYQLNFTVFMYVTQISRYIQGVPGGKINILGGHSIGHSKQKCLYEHVSYSERFPR